MDQKYVLITGCDSGFGRETAIRLDKMGAYVLATCLTEEGEKSLRSATSDKLKTFRLDVTNSEQIKDLYEDIQRLLPSDQGRGLLEHFENVQCRHAIRPKKVHAQRGDNDQPSSYTQFYFKVRFKRELQ